MRSFGYFICSLAEAPNIVRFKIYFSRKGAKDAKVIIGLMLALSYEAINCSGYAMFH